MVRVSSRLPAPGMAEEPAELDQARPCRALSRHCRGAGLCGRRRLRARLRLGSGGRQRATPSSVSRGQHRRHHHQWRPLLRAPQDRPREGARARLHGRVHRRRGSPPDRPGQSGRATGRGTQRRPERLAKRIASRAPVAVQLHKVMLDAACRPRSTARSPSRPRAWSRRRLPATIWRARRPSSRSASPGLPGSRRGTVRSAQVCAGSLLTWSPTETTPSSTTRA